MTRLTLLCCSLLAACSVADEPPPALLPHQANVDVDWRDQVIYQIVVDRFANGDPSNDLNVAPTVPGRYHGGDWQGVIDNLGYLEELGVTALWISPVVKNTEEDAGFASYHGYWTQDPVRPNQHFGDLAKLRELVDAAHARGMLVILDVVTNHMGQLFYYDINGNGMPDDSLSGGGYSHTCLQICDNPARAAECTADEHTYCALGRDYLERIIEWDPEYDPRGIQGWSTLGFSGPADVRFTDWPELNRTPPPRPPSWLGWPDDKPWFDDPTWYNRKGRVYVWWHEADYSASFVREQETTGDFPGGLKDLDTDHPDVQEALIRSFEYWIEVADFDGFRVDTVKHIDRPDLDVNDRAFWGRFTDRMRAKARSLGKQNFFLFGEAFDGNDRLLGLYTTGGADADGAFGRFDSVFYFSQKYRVVDELWKRGGATKHAECQYNARVGRNPGDAFCQAQGYDAGPNYPATPHAASADGGIGLPPQQVLVNFLDNHDLPRFGFEVSDAAVRGALYYLMTWDGIPCVYYGTEQGFAGGVDPKNREDFFAGNPALGYPAFDTSNPHFALVRDLIALRREHVALRRGTVAFTWATEVTGERRDEGILAFERAAEGDRVLVVLNSSGGESETCAPAGDGGACMATSFASGTVLEDVGPDGGGATFTVGAGGTLAVTVPAYGGRILVPR
ncbi:MAG: alpha-amylase family glycosyl hydrolase [Kofleriaceae bacterium]